MIIKDYITLNGNIFTTNDPIFTSDIKLAVNRMLKYNYRDKEMLYYTPEEVQELVEMVLMDNKYKYINQFNLMSYVLPEDYTDKSNNIGSKQNTGTVKNNNTVIKDNTGTQVIAGEDTIDNTGTQEVKNSGTVKNTGTDKVKIDSSDTVDPNNVIKSTGAFEAGELVPTEKNESSLNKKTIDGTELNTQDLTRTDDLSNLRTDALKQKSVKSDTRTDNLKEMIDGFVERTDNLQENLINDVKNMNVSIRLAELQKMQENTANLLYRVITEDIIQVLTLRTW